FQAEDGIRDYKVTGVQTCALPISSRPIKTFVGSDLTPKTFVATGNAVAAFACVHTTPRAVIICFALTAASFANPGSDVSSSPIEIGRASCRERVRVVGVESTLNGQ